MITSDFTGNFGNHLFQYVATRVIADKKGLDYGFTKHIYGDYYGGRSQFDFFNLDYGKGTEGLVFEDYKEKVVQVEYCGDIINIHKVDDFKELKNNSKICGCWQQMEPYFREHKEDIKKWLEIDRNKIFEYLNVLAQYNINLDENLTIINLRGGEYLSIPNVLLPKSYVENSIFIMKRRNPNMKFIIITDDIKFYQQQFPSIPCIHHSIGFDYWIINNAKWVILSNSSFPMFAAYLNDKANLILAPKYWSRFNTSDGVWGNSLIMTSNFKYLDRNGNVEPYSQIIEELRNSKYWKYYF